MTPLGAGAAGAAGASGAPAGGQAAAEAVSEVVSDPPADVVSALARTHEWFEVNSGWAPPDEGTMIDWGLEGIGRAPDECLVAEYGVCPHGLVSWQIVLDDLVEHDLAREAVRPPPRRPAAHERPEPVSTDGTADPDHRVLGLP